MQRNTLSEYEAGIIKKLLEIDERSNQEIAGLINRSRGDASSDINGGRISDIKNDNIQKYINVQPATDADVEFFLIKLNSFESQTGLNLYDDERLIRAREAMLVAVQIFNSPTLSFKTEIFSILSNVAWTYLMHEYYSKKISITDTNGKTTELSTLINRSDCPLSKGMIKNLKAIKEIRDSAEHRLLGKSDPLWQHIFQACCLNFDKAICELFGSKLSLQSNLSFALQFAKLNTDQISTVQSYEIPEHIEALDARLNEEFIQDNEDDLEYRFRVIYTLDAASKNHAHMSFVNPESAEGKEIKNILVKHRSTEKSHPLKVTKVIGLIKEKTGISFSQHNHTQAWSMHKVRPKGNSLNPEQTVQKYCTYHALYESYTYSLEWVDFLCELAIDPIKLKQLKSYKD